VVKPRGESVRDEYFGLSHTQTLAVWLLRDLGTVLLRSVVGRFTYALLCRRRKRLHNLRVRPVRCKTMSFQKDVDEKIKEAIATGGAKGNGTDLRRLGT
jgi:hypothetical protein